MDHGTYRQLAAGSALDDLDPAEHSDFERHRAACRSCRTLAEELQTLTAELALAAPRRPPAELRLRVLDAIHVADQIRPDGPAEPGGSDPGPTEAVARPPATVLPFPGTRRGGAQGPGELTRLHAQARRSRILAATSLAAAAVIAVGAVGMTIRAAQLSDELATSRTAAASAEAVAAAARSALAEQGAAMSVAVDPSHLTAALHPESLAPSATATVLYLPGTDESFLMATGLPATPPGTVYQLWVADAAGVHALGTYAFDGRGAFLAPIGMDLSRASATMVTLEPAGGAHGAPGPQVVFGEL